MGLDNRALTKLRHIQTLATLQITRQRSVLIEVPPKTSAMQFLQNKLGKAVMAHAIKHCNTGAQHPQSKRPAAARTTFLTNIPLVCPEACQCGRPLAEHAREDNRGAGMELRQATRIMREAFISMVTSMVALASAGRTMGVPELTGQLTDEPPGLTQIKIPPNAPTPTSIQTTTQLVRRYLDNTHAKPHENLTDMQLRAIGLPLPLPQRNIDTTDQAFPTESRMKQKAKEAELKAQGQEIVRVKRPKHIAAGDDDLGADTATISAHACGPDTYLDYGSLDAVAACEIGLIFDELEEDFLIYFEADLCPYHFLYGSDFVGIPNGSPQSQKFGNFFTFLHYWYKEKSDDEFVDVAEICGGTARTSFVLLRRRHKYKVGLNFDVVVGIDLLNSHEEHAMWAYFQRTQPLVAIMATPCTGLAGYKGINAARGCPMHFINRDISIKLGNLGGQVAVWQLDNLRHIIAESPWGSDLWQLPPWKQTERYPQIRRRKINMCMAGMTDFDYPDLYILKATEIRTSHKALDAPLQDLECDGRHDHIPIGGNCSDGEKRSHKCRIWPWGLATRLASGIAAVVREERTGQEAYPVASTQAGAGEPPPGQRKRSNRFHWPCRACRNNKPDDHPTHS